MPVEHFRQEDRSSGRHLEPDHIKTVQACRACRASKVRCIQSEDGRPCERCSKSGRECFPVENSTKRQKRLHPDHHPGRDVTTTVRTIRDVSEWSREDGSMLRSTAASLATPDPSSQHRPTATAAPPSALSTISPLNIEASIAEIVNEETSNAIFQEFTTKMLPEFPFMAFPQGVTARDVCNKGPVTFLAILDVAADGFCELEAIRNLRKLLLGIYMKISPGNAELTLPLLQAFIISACWNRSISPAQPGENIDLNQLIHAFTSMAILMGLGRTLAAQTWNNPMMPAESRRLRGPEGQYQARTLDARRIWLGCHYVSSNVSMAEQSPNIMRWTRYMDECLEVLEKSPASLPSDKVLCRHIRLQHILEEFELQLYESPSRSIAPESTHAGFRAQLETWAATSFTWTDSLRFSHQFVKLYMHEIAMYSAQTNYSSLSSERDSPTIGVSEFTDCLMAAHGLLDVFLSLDMSLIRALPTVYSVRVTYAAVVLVKLYFASARLHDAQGASEMTLSLNVDEYFGRLLQKLNGWGTLWPAWRLMKVLRKVQELFRQNKGQRRKASEAGWLNSWQVGETSSAVAGPHGAAVQGEASLRGNGAASRREIAQMTKEGETMQCHGANNTMRYDATLPFMDLWTPDLMDINQLNQWLDNGVDTSAFEF